MILALFIIGKKSYWYNSGRKDYSLSMMFKYFLLKDIYKLSNMDVVEGSLSEKA